MTRPSGAGLKAAGLCELPSYWTPPFVAIDATVAATVRGAPTSTNQQVAARLKRSKVGEPLEDLFRGAGNGVLVRSSAPREDLYARGLHESMPVSYPTFLTVAEAMRTVWAHAGSVDADPAAIPLLVQQKVDAPILGHLSNERRLKEDRRDWVVELRHPPYDAKVFGLRAKREDRIDLSDVDLECTAAKGLRSVLRRIAGALTESGVRCHIEWLWDGYRVWVVQYDKQQEKRCRSPRADVGMEAFGDLQVFRPSRRQDSRIPKLACAMQYAQLGLPHGDLRVLDNPTALRGLLRGRSTPALERDFQELSRAKAVLRTDVRRQNNFDVLLPRTDSGKKPNEIHQFLVTALRDLTSEGVALDDIAFLAHPFIPADASAWSLAAPASQEVRVDATFGLPDGLLYYPHDSYTVHARDGILKRHLRCKSPILTCDEDGIWRDQALGPPWDWRPALSDDEAKEIARISKALADAVGEPVETMFFVGARMPDGEPRVLPWVHRVQESGSRTASASDLHFPSEVFDVRGQADLFRLKETIERAGQDGARILVRLIPVADVLHTKGFLTEVAALCRPERTAVELAGSTLSHAYYELVRSGVQVHVVDPIEPIESAPIAFDKLVRNLIPEKIEAKGERVRSYRASGLELEGLLRRKAVEEALEAAEAQTQADLVEELGDLVDVLAALCRVTGASLEKLIEWTEQKRRERGGFDEGIVLIETRERSLEEALADEGDTFDVSPEVSEAVAHERRSQQEIPQEVADESLVPYRIGQSRGHPVVIDGTVFEVSLTARGILLRRARPVSDPDQMRFDVDP